MIGYNKGIKMTERKAISGLIDNRSAEEYNSDIMGCVISDDSPEKEEYLKELAQRYLEWEKRRKAQKQFKLTVSTGTQLNN